MRHRIKNVINIVLIFLIGIFPFQTMQWDANHVIADASNALGQEVSSIPERKLVDTEKVLFDDDYLSEYADETRKADFHRTDIETQNAFIENFDVSTSGEVLICLENEVVNVYDASGAFRYAIEYDSNHSSSMAFWDENNIVIYIFREHICAFFDEDGSLDNIYEFSGDSSNLINHVLKRRKFVANNHTYTSDKSNALVFFSSRDNQVTKRGNNTGEVETIYCYTKAGYKTLKFAFEIFLFLIAFALAIVYIVNRDKFNKRIERYFKS